MATFLAPHGDTVTEAFLDNASTTKVCDAAVNAAVAAMTSAYGNPSSSHRLGRESKRILDESRKAIADTLRASPSEIFFTSGGTESDNWAILCGAESRKRQGSHVISSLVEHDAVLESLKILETRGFEVTRLAPSELTVSGVLNALREDTILVSLMMVNNEIGAVTDIGAISEAMKKAGSTALLHTDAVQAYLKLPIDTRRLGADLISLSAHKIHGPKGAGALYIKQDTKLPPLISGGGQESGKRSGTEALPSIAAFAAAASEGFASMTESVIEMRGNLEHAIGRLSTENPSLIVNGADSPNILSVSLPGYKSEVLMSYLDSRGVYVSKGSACKRGARSHVLEAMKLPANVIDGTLRVSLSRFTTRAEIDYFCDVLRSARENLLTSTR